MTAPAAPKRKKPLAGICQCGERGELEVVDGRYQFVNHVCRKKGAPTQLQNGDGVLPGGEKRSVPTFSNAKPTDCSSGHRHDSKMEMRVCERLTAEVADYNTKARIVAIGLVRQIRLPLLLLCGQGEKPTYITIDFAIQRNAGPRLWRLIDAKAKGRVSRDWPARKKACELTFGIEIEEVDK